MGSWPPPCIRAHRSRTSGATWARTYSLQFAVPVFTELPRMLFLPTHHVACGGAAYMVVLSEFLDAACIWEYMGGMDSSRWHRPHHWHAASSCCRRLGRSVRCSRMVEKRQLSAGSNMCTRGSAGKGTGTAKGGPCKGFNHCAATTPSLDPRL